MSVFMKTTLQRNYWH